MRRLLIFLVLSFFISKNLKSQTGSSLHFDGTDDRVFVTSLNFGSTWSAECWARPTDVNLGWHTIMGQSYWDAPGGWVVAIYSGTVFVQTPGGINITTTVTVNTWVHLAVTYSSGVFAFYKNGNIVGVQTGTFANAGQPFYMGMRTNNNAVGLVDAYEGNIDEVRVWNTTRSGCDIQRFMNCEINGAAAGLVANYHFNQGFANGINIVTSVTDDTGNGNTGSMQNFGLNIGPTSNWASQAGVPNNFTTVATISPEVEVTGNGSVIADGDMTPSPSDHTDFSGVSSRTFIVSNTGTTALSVGNPVFLGANAVHFTVSTLPASPVAANTGTTSFVVGFVPNSPGVKTTTLVFYNSDCSEPTYSFALTATAIAAEALSFDGTNDYIETSANLVQLGQNDFTIETWLKTSTNDFGIATMQDADGSWESGEKCFLMENDGHLMFVGHSCDYIHANTLTPVNDNNWHHVALVWDLQSGVNGIGKIYIDGIDRTSSSTYTANTANLGTFRIGRPNFSESAAHFQGNLDEFRVWNVARTQCEIQSYMNCEITSTASGLVANYHFNHGAAAGNNTVTVATNATGGANGTLTNFTLTGNTSNWVQPGGVVMGNTVTTPPASSIAVIGNGNAVTYNSVVTSTLNHTNFSTVSTRTFVIQNTGAGTLAISSVSLSGAGAASFTVTVLPAASVAPSGSTSMVIVYTPTAPLSFSANVAIVNNDCAKPVFNFVIEQTPPVADALHFDGSNDIILLPDNCPAWDLGKEFSVEMWIKPQSLSTQLLLYSGYGCIACPEWALSMGPELTCVNNGTSGRLVFYAMGNSVESNASPTLGVWQHVAVTYNSSVMKMYLNGVLQSNTVSVPGGSVNPSTYRNIGGDPSSIFGCNIRYLYQGSMDELRFWNKALCSSEVVNSMSCEITTTAQGLTANYHFNQGYAAGSNATVTSLTDVSGNAATGTLTGFGLTGGSSNWIGTGGVVSTTSCTLITEPDIRITGNSENISIASAMPSPTDNTYFGDIVIGSTSSQTFVIENTGTATLGITGYTVTGPDAGQFSITQIPSANVALSGSTTIVVTFSPSSIGQKSATLTVGSTDCDEGQYYFSIEGLGAMPGEALDFDGSDDYMMTGIDADMDAMPNTTWEAWIYPTIADNNYRQIMSIDDGGWDRFIGMNNGVVVIGAGFQWNPTSFTMNQWQHIALVYTGDKVKFYKNGVEYVTTTTHSVGMTNANLAIGCRTSPIIEFFGGMMDEVRIWDVARSQCAIQNYMNCEIPGPMSNLVANYHFNQGLAAATNTNEIVLLDNSGNGNDLGLTNFALTGTVSNWVEPGAVVSGFTTTAGLNVDAELEISGNGNYIAVGDLTSTVVDFTDIGNTPTLSVLSKTFVLTNSGVDDVSISGFTLSGLDASSFTVTSAPAVSLAPTATTSMVLSFSAGTLGTRVATLTIGSDDCERPLYDFAVRATAATPANALHFQRINANAGDFIEIPHSPALHLNTDFTLEAWINWTGTDNAIIDKGNYDYLFEANPFNTGYLGFYNITDNVWNYSTQTLTPGTWQHVAITVSAGGYTFYIDGQSAGSGTTTPTQDNGPVNIGRQAPNNCSCNYFNGYMDEVRIWNVARSCSEISANMNNELTGTEFGLAAYYNFNQGFDNVDNEADSVLIDPVGGNNGDLIGFALTGSVSNWVNPGSGVTGTVTTPQPEIDLLGLSQPIAAEDMSVSLLDNTDLGAAFTATFEIQNSGNATLNLGTATITGVNASDFSITVPPPSSLAASANATFEVTFIPSALGARTATVEIPSDDCDEGNYRFAIEGTGIAAEAMSFDGTNDIAGRAVFNTATDNITLQGKVYWTNTGNGNNKVLLYNGHSSISGYGLYMSSNTGDVSILFGGIVFQATGFTLTPNQWTDLTMVIESGITSFYADGVLTMTASIGLPNTPSTNFQVAGNSNNAFEAFGAIVDEVRLWTRPLSQCEIQAQINCEIATTGSSLVANYHFNQGISHGQNSTVTTVTDFSGNNFALTFSNTALTGSASNWVSPGAVQTGSNCPAYIAPEINLVGNGVDIPDGAFTATVSNDTDFGTICENATVVKTFTIENNGSNTLVVNSIVAGGGDAGSFLVSALSPTPPITASNSAVFSVTFMPQNSGTLSAYIEVSNDDCNEPFYTFTIGGIAEPLPVLTTLASANMVCDGSTVTLSASGADTYTWTGGVVDGVAFTPTVTDSYTVTGTNTLTGCSNTNIAVETVTVELLPVITASAMNAAICEGDINTLTAGGADTYTWEPGGLTGNNLPITPLFSTSYSVSGTSTTGCNSSNTVVVNITVNPLPVVSASANNTVICEGATITLSGGGAHTYTWQPTGADLVPFAPAATTDFTVTGTNTLTGCTSTNLAAVEVTVNTLPAVSATANVQAVCIGNSVTLNGLGADSYTWNPAAPNNTAFGPTVTTSFSVTGTSTLTGCTSTNIAAVTITVNALPSVTANISNPVVCQGNTTSVFGSGADTYTWAPVTANGAAFVPAASGIYTVSGTNTLTGCTSTNIATAGLTVNALPAVSASVGPNVICNGSTVVLNGGGADTYTWQPAGLNLVPYTPTASTTFTVSGTNTLTGCTSTNLATIAVTVNALPVVTATSNVSAVCIGNSVTLNGVGADTYTWNPAAPNNSAFGPTITTSYSVIGSSTLTGCTSTNIASVTITVNALPVVTANISNPVVCVGFTTSVFGSGADTYTWAPVTANGAAFVPAASGIYTVSGTSTLTGCTSTNITTTGLTVNPLPAVSASVSPNVICSGNSILLSGGGADTYTWQPAGLNLVPYTPTAGTTFTVAGTNTLTGCTSTNLATIAVTVNALPVVTATANVPAVCIGNSVTLNGVGADTYTWTGGATDGTAFAPGATTAYTVTGTNTLTGCTSTNVAAITITVNARPTVAAATSNSVVCQGGTTSVNGSGADTYTWSPVVVNGATFVPAATTAYTVTGTNTLTGCTSTNLASVGITVNALPFVTGSVVPNVICAGGTVSLQGSGADTYTWLPTGLNLVPFTPTGSTVFTVTGTSTLTGCTSTNLATVPLTVNPLPVVTAASSSAAICLGLQVTLTGGNADTYTWTPTGTNGIPFSPTITTTYSISGTNTLTGCTSTNLASVTVTVNPLPIVTAAVTNPTICMGANTTLNGSNANTYTWTPTAPNATPFSPTVSATYSVTGTNTLTGCVSTNVATVAVTVNTLPVVSATITNSVVCMGGTTALNGGGANTYTWNPAAIDGVSFMPVASTNYTVSGTNTLTGCTSTNVASIGLTVNPLPVVTASVNNSVVCIGSPIILTGGNANTYTWNPTATNATAFNPTITASYTVTGTNTLTGCTSTNLASVGVTVNALPVVTASITNSVICMNGTTTLNGGGANTYTWNPVAPNGTAFSPAASGAYTLAGTNTLTGCTSSNAPSVSVTVNPLPVVTASIISSVICIGFTTALNGGGADTYTWNPVVVNGATFAPGASQVYTVSGTNTLTGCTSTNLASIGLTVNVLPVVTASVTNSVICFGGTTSVNGGGADTFTWNPLVTNGASISPTINTSYSVTGTSTLTGCTSTNLASVGVTVNPLPVVTASITNSVICMNGTTTLNGGGANTYTWLPNGTDAAVFSPTISETFTVSGTNTLTGCASTNLATTAVTVNALPSVTANASSTYVCSGGTVMLSGSGASTYTWTGGVTDALTFTPATTTSYTVSGTSTAGCTSTNVAEVTVTVETLPVLTASVTNSVLCFGDTFTATAAGANTYSWTGGLTNGTAFTPTSTSSYSVTGSSSMGCLSSNTAVVSVTVNALPLVLANASKTIICLGDSSIISGAGAITYTWSGSLANNTAVTPTQSSTYTLSGTDANGCKNTATVMVTVNVLPGLTVASSNTLSCEAETTTLTASGANTYTWNNSTITGSTIVITPTSTAVFTISASDVNGCSNSLLFTQSVTACPGTVNIIATHTNVTCGEKIDGAIYLDTLVSYPNRKINYYWQPVNICPNNDCSSIDSLKAGTYTVTVVVNYTLNNVFAKRDTVHINPITILNDKGGPCLLTIFSGFSPNQDGINDVWTIDNISEFPNNTVTIFNRWGMQLYETKGYNNGNKSWPQKGDEPTAGTYFYVIDPGDGSKPVRGWVEVVKD